MRTDNTKLYQSIKQELQANPALKAATVCRLKGASYGGYRFWDEKQGDGAEESKTKVTPRSDLKSVVTLEVNIEELVKAYFEGQDKITFPLMDLIEKLPAEKVKEFVIVSGRRRKQV